MSWSDFLRPLVFATILGTLLAESKPAPSPTPDDTAGFELPVPEGMPVNGIKVPQYDENGKRLMLFEAAVAKKVNEQLVDMQALQAAAANASGCCESFVHVLQDASDAYAHMGA